MSSLSTETLRPMPIRAEDDPLDLILAEHARQRVLFGLLDRVATLGTADPDTAARLQTYLTETLPLHWRDEEEDLLPRLRRRAEPEDAIEAALARMLHDHDASAAVAVTLSRAIALMAKGQAPDTETRATLRAFADRERRHLIFENAIIIPLARVRLTAADRHSMLRLMAQRRGQSLPTMP